LAIFRPSRDAGPRRALVGAAVVEAREHPRNLLERAHLGGTASGGDVLAGAQVVDQRIVEAGVWLSKNSQLAMTTGA
jgi:hypothetical protein